MCFIWNTNGTLPEHSVFRWNTGENELFESNPTRTNRLPFHGASGIIVAASKWHEARRKH
jgi:hypothetical protein